MESFIAGFCYGGTTVVVGQPLDTIKTLQQSSAVRKTFRSVCGELWTSGGIAAFYRGGGPLLLGGGLMRSAQFGFYSNTLSWIRDHQGGKTAPNNLLVGVVDPQVVLAGFAGGIGRALVESPFEYVKVRNQVQTQWRFREALHGSGTTLLRNAFLFSSFVVYMDLSKRSSIELSPFFMGGICANLAWLTIWPLDVVKSKLQSGKFQGQSMWDVLKDTVRSGHLYRGLGAGLVRSFIANGTSMTVYKYVEDALKNQPLTYSSAAQPIKNGNGTT